MLPCPVPNCGYKNEIDATICAKCGEDLSSFSHLYFLSSFYYNQGLQAAQNNNFDEAIKDLLVAISLDQGNIDTLILLGKIYAQKGDFNNAIEYWQNVLEISPGNEEVKKAIEKAAKILDEEPVPSGVIDSSSKKFFDNISSQLELIRQSFDEKSKSINRIPTWQRIILGSVIVFGISFFILLFIFRQNFKNQIMQTNTQISKLENKIADVKNWQEENLVILDKKTTNIQTDQKNTHDSVEEVMKKLSNISKQINQTYEIQTGFIKNLNNIRDNFQNISVSMTELNNKILDLKNSLKNPDEK